MARLELLLDLLFPPKCPFCGALLEKGDLLCPDCQRDLPWLLGEQGKAAVELTGGCASALRYQDRVREAIQGYKFGGKSGRSKTFGTLVAQAVRDQGFQAELVSWPPLSKKRLRQRGYDQAQLLAQAVGEELGLPVIPTLEKTHRPAQSGLSDPGQRRANVLGAYAAVDPEVFWGRSILLVDDVLTTGATLSECAKTLRLAGSGEIFCATLARAG